jgi:hypothetical protein
MLCAVDEDDSSRFVDFIDHAKLPPAGRVQPFELALEWWALEPQVALHEQRFVVRSTRERPTQ